MGSEDFSLEDAVIDSMQDGYETVERPLAGRLFTVFGIVAGLLMAVFIGRTAYFGFAEGSQFESRAYANAGQEIILRAPRGIIYDRYGTPLVENKASFNVSLNLSELFKHKNGIENILQDIHTYVDFDMQETQDTLQHIDLEKQAYLILARNVSVQSIIELKKADIPSVTIENGYIRSYPNAEAFAHVVGYTGLVTKEDLQKDSSLDLNDEIGKSGVELVYDRYLRGENGSRIILRDAQNNTLGERVDKEVQSGDKVYTAIDAGLQEELYKDLKEQLSSLNRTSGAGLVLNPQTGDVLAMVSMPSFDTNNLSSDLFTDSNKPTFNRVVSGVYSPGSTIKPLVAFGALEEGIIDPMKSILSIGYIELPNPYDPAHPSRFVDWRVNGWVNLYSAIAKSCNIYFYEVGGGFQDQPGLGIDHLREYWQKFLLDKKTGIDLPGEAEGYLPSPDAKEKRTGQIWRIGDTYNVSIGQGDLLISPLELLRYIGGIAMKGKLAVPHVVSNIQDGNAKVYKENVSFDVVAQKDPVHLDEVEAGMLQTVQKDYGTAYTLHNIPMTIAAKTGSAQIQNNQKTNAFFVGYNVPRPESAGYTSDNIPQQIAVLVLIEDAREGSLNAVPVAEKVFQWYYQNRIATTTNVAESGQ